MSSTPHPFVVACATGSPGAQRHLATLVPRDAAQVVRAGLLAALEHGHTQLACALLAAPGPVRAAALQSKSVLLLAARPGREEALDALLALDLPASTRARALLDLPPDTAPSILARVGKGAFVLALTAGIRVCAHG